MTFKKALFQLHKILGLATGIVVFITAITGCLWVFQEEIQDTYNSYKTVTPMAQPMLTPTEAKRIASDALPGHHIHGALYQKEADAIEVIFYDLEPEFYQTVYLNPYSGSIIHIEDHLSGFFPFVLQGHMYLWLPKEFGSQVMGISVLIFLFIVISGLYLWWPKKRKHLKKRTTFEWNSTTRWKRKNYDLHTVIGFYVCGLAFILAFTGSVLLYDWFRTPVYTMIGGDKSTEFVIPEGKSTPIVFNDAVAPIDALLVQLQKELPDANGFELHFPDTETASIYVEVSGSEGVIYDADYRFFDQYTLEELETPSVYGTYKDATMSDTALRMNYDVHVGAIGGIFGKVIAFLSSLLVASLPVTGVLLWYGRDYKKKA